MDDQLPLKNPTSKKHRRQLWLFVLVFLLLGSFFGIYYGFNYFGELFLRKYLQQKIRVSSNGLYFADFKTLHLNILTGKVVIDSFELIPDTLHYQRLKAQGKIARALYRISFLSLTIDKVHFRQIYAGKRINFRQLTVQRPLLSIVAFPDTVSAKRARWRVIYEDLYPAVSGFFNDFHIDSVKVNHGYLFTTFRQKTGRKTTGEYEFSSVLKDVSVNPFSYYNPKRVFYSGDVELVIHNFESQLADSLYLLKSEEIGFSLTKSILYGKKATLMPNFNSGRIRQVQSGDLFRIDLPSFSISGIDLYRAMTGREVEISALNLTDFFMRVYRNKPLQETAAGKKSKKKITLAGLYTVVAKELRFIAIDTLRLKNGSFEFYGNPADVRPELHIGKVDLELSQFRLDSLTHLDQSRIFYSRAIELELKRITLFLSDGIHSVNASAISFSTGKSTIDVHEANIIPDRKKNTIQQAGRRNTMFVNLPRLTFTGIDLKKVFNRRILDFDRLTIHEPEVSYTRFRPPKNPDPRFKKPGDFFETGNEEVVYHLLKKYLWVVRGNEINITHGFAKFSVEKNGLEMPLATTGFDLSMKHFLIDSVHGMNEQGYFYSRDFILDLQSVSVVSPDSLKHLQAGRVHVATSDSLIEAENIHVYRSTSPMQVTYQLNKRSLTFEFSLNKLQLTGLNHKKLFLEKILKANQVVLESPVVLLKTGNKLQPEGPPEEAQLLKTGNFVHTIEIGHCLVQKGAISYDGEEDRKASYFSLKEIDFEVADARVRLPEKRSHDGSIRFNSLQLKMFPLRAVIADSAYTMEARSLEVHSYPADITLKGIRVTPLNSPNKPQTKKNVVSIDIPEIRLNGFYFDRAIFDNQWMLDGLYVDYPAITFETWPNRPGSVETAPFDPANITKIPHFMRTVSVNTVSVKGAETRLIIHKPDGKRTYSLSDVTIDINRFRVDSATRLNPAGSPLFNAEDITLSVPGYSWVPPDSLYTFNIGRIGLSTGSGNAFLDSVSVNPNFSRQDFSRKVGHQTDRIELKIPRISVLQVDFRKLIRDRQLHAARVSFEDMSFKSYRDKRFPFPTWQRPPMPGQMIGRIGTPLCIDTVVLHNGVATYEEQTGDEPGRIFFDRINTTLTGPVVPPKCLDRFDLHGTCNLMGLAPTELWVHFQTIHPRDTFTLHATIGELDLTAINPMLSNLLPVSIKRGIASGTEIVQLNGNNTRAEGMMNFRYSNLAIRLHPTQPGTWNHVGQSLLSEAVNLLLADSNPADDGKMKHGVISMERDPSKGFINFIWKSVLSGIKSSAGIKNKSRKESQKTEKKTMK